MPSPTLTSWNGGYILFAQFLTFEQESIKAKLDNHKCQTRLEKRLIAIRYSQ